MHARRPGGCIRGTHFEASASTAPTGPAPRARSTWTLRIALPVELSVSAAPDWVSRAPAASWCAVAPSSFGGNRDRSRHGPHHLLPTCSPARPAAPADACSASARRVSARPPGAAPRRAGSRGSARSISRIAISSAALGLLLRPPRCEPVGRACAIGRATDQPSRIAMPSSGSRTSKPARTALRMPTTAKALASGSVSQNSHHRPSRLPGRSPPAAGCHGWSCG